MKTGTDRVEPELGLRRLDCVPEVLWQSRFSAQNLLVLQPVQRAAPVHFAMGEGFDPEPGGAIGTRGGEKAPVRAEPEILDLVGLVADEFAQPGGEAVLGLSLRGRTTTSGWT